MLDKPLLIFIWIQVDNIRAKLYVELSDKKHLHTGIINFVYFLIVLETPKNANVKIIN